MLQNTPQVVKNLIILNVLMYLGAGLMGPSEFVEYTSSGPKYIPNGDLLFAAFYPNSPFFRPWQILTHMFMHGGVSHIFFNMFALYMFGSQLERVWGPKRFLKYYIFCGLGAFALHEFFFALEVYASFDGEFFPSLDTLPQTSETLGLAVSRVVGASGAVFGLLLAFGMLFPNTQLMLLFPPIPIRAKYFVLGYGAIELILALRNNPGDNVAHFAHLGGMIFGYFLLKRWQRDRVNFY